ncbi:beta strand repeat-containing protein, partial [Undibacterium sp. MH2W]|uniref:beta strand repeat-containing protein n=1 Tax=Undibacterium sp. MH2W TaxID=3413044 RepID=UPI003BF156F9
GLASNYVLPSLSNASLNNKATINAVTTAVNIIGNSQSGTYNGNQQSVSGFTATGLVGSDTAANISGFAATGAIGTNAGSYTNIVNGSNSNYSNIIFTNGSLNIDRAIATINATKTYDSTTNLNAGQISVTGINGQTLNYTGTASANNANVAANSSNYVSGITGLADGTGLASNYVLPSLSSASLNNKATINAVTTAVNIIGNSQSGTYSGNQQSVSGFTATGLVGSDTAANISGITASGATGTNAGSYTNIVSGSNSNYSNIIFTNGTLNIDRAIATINATKTYDSTTNLNAGQISVTGVNGQTLNYTGTASANNANVAANSSNYVSGITGLADGTGLASNYVLPSLSSASLNNKATINAVTTAVNIIGNSQSGTYNGNQQSVSGFTATGLVGSDTTANISGIISSGAMGTNAGSYTNIVSGSNSNYSNIIFTNGSLNIDRAIATINATKTYDSTTNLNAGQISVTGVNGQTLNYTGTASANNANVAANGSNYVSGITGLADGTGLASNYILPSLSVQSLNNKATINAVTTAVNIVGNSQSGTYNGNQQSVSGFSATGLVGTDTAANISGIAARGAIGTNAGTYTNTVSGSNSNYSNIIFTNGTLNIDRAIATINATKTYDSTTSLTSGQVNITGVNGQTLNYTGTASANNANVAANGSNYVSGITGLADGTGLASNYVLPSLSSASLNNKATINAVTTAVNIIGNSQSGTYNGNQQSVSGFSATGLVGTDTAANISGIAASGAIGTNAGTYTNTVSGSNSNYSNIIFTNGTLNIDRAIATINATKTYDSTTSLTSGQVNITGVNGQTLNYTGTASANNANVAANGSNYVSGITGLADGTGLASNYVLPSLSSASLNNKATINAVTTAVNIIGNSQSGTYNGNQQSVSGFTATGLVGTDTAANISGITASGAIGTNAGTYTNIVSGSNSNYSNIIFTNGTLNIDRAIATINATKTYDSTTSLTSGQVNITGINGQTLNYTGTASANNANVVANGSNYVSGITGLADGTGLASNYILPSLSVRSLNNKATINAVTTAVNIIGNSQSGTYNGNQQSISGFTATGLVGSDTAANISGFTASGAIGTNAGTYTNIVSGSNSNYSNIIFTNGTLNIDRAIATINATKTYDSTTSLTSGQVNITGVNGQTLNYTGTAV